MTGLLEDILSDEDVNAINAVQASNISRFDRLVVVAGLDPMADFQYSDLRYVDMRNADLRGFDFTGSDLRNCIINSGTRIDDTTIFERATLSWIEVEALPVVQRMQEIEMTDSPVKRQKLLGELVAEHGRTHHVVTYMVRAACNANQLDQLLDFVTQLPANLSSEQMSAVREQSERLLLKKIKQAKRRTGRQKTAIFSVEPIASRLKDSPGELGRVLYGHLADVVNDKTDAHALPGMAVVEPADLEAAFARLGRL